MSKRFQELDRQMTPMGEISVRRRFHPTLEVDVWEVILGNEHLMSSLFTAAEIALADLGLAALTATDLDVVVGGLGLGYTARAVLADPRVRSLHVVEALGAVIDWHERDVLPDARLLTEDPRCHFVHGDFFAMVAGGEAFGEAPGHLDAILVDIDHTPSHVLDPSHSAFYTAEGLSRLGERLRPGGVFALWSDDPPDADFVAVLDQVFAESDAHLVTFANPITGGEAANSVYVARTSSG